MSLKDNIDKNKLPKHVAIIMDGNGRWAKTQGLERFEGHKAGVGSVRIITEVAADLQIPYLTLYTFSKENWNRPEGEIKALMSLFIQAVANETADLLKNNVRLAAIGDIDSLPLDTRRALEKCIEDTSVSTGLTLVLALSYSSRWEITNAMKNIAKKIESSEISTDDISEDMISENLTTKNIPDPDLLIRTGGEFRISNFLLWQAAYAEFYFTETLWPNFNKDAFLEAILDYQSRERRFGKTSEQVTNK